MKRSSFFFTLSFILILLAGTLSAWGSSANTPEINGNPRGWQKINCKGKDIVGEEGVAPFVDLCNFFYDQQVDRLNFRINLLGMTDRDKTVNDFRQNGAAVYLCVDYREGGTNSLPELGEKAPLKWDICLVCRYTKEGKGIGELYGPDLKRVDGLRKVKFTPKRNMIEASILLPEGFREAVTKAQGLKVDDYGLIAQRVAEEDGTPVNFFCCSVLDGQIMDTIQATNKKGTTGNCAFVQHGNQGLTWTDVFRGPDGDTLSGYDEVLKVHDSLGVPVNLHLAATLQTAAEWYDRDFNDWIRQGISEGWICMVTSAYAQHIMPFVYDDMNRWAVKTETDLIDSLYGYESKIAWVPERVWLSQGYYPDRGLSDPWLGDNWTDFGIQAVILDDWPHCQNMSDTRKITWMNDGSEITLRVIPINGDFVGNVNHNPTAAINQIQASGQYCILVYGNDWEVVAELYQHAGTDYLENYTQVVEWCADTYPGVDVWKLDEAINNSGFDYPGIDLVNGTYASLGGTDGYGGGNNFWYVDWDSSRSHSDFHNPKWGYTQVWQDACNSLMTAPDNNLAQAGWYVLMGMLSETGWHDEDGQISGWEQRYSSHMKNANVYAEAAHWANGEYANQTAAYFSDIDHDGADELVMHNDSLFAVFESIGGKANWIFVKEDTSVNCSVVGNDPVYWAETEGDWNEGNHKAAFSDVSFGGSDQEHFTYDMQIDQGSGDTAQITLSRPGFSKTIRLVTGKSYLDAIYHSGSQRMYIQSGFSPDLVDLIWQADMDRIWATGKYCGVRNPH